MGKAQTRVIDSGVVGPIKRSGNLSRTLLESWTTKGDSPVDEKRTWQDWHLSRAGHVKPGSKQGGPPPKAKYSLITDSEPVP